MAARDPPHDSDGVDRYVNPDTSEGVWTPQTVLSSLPQKYPTRTPSPLPFLHLIERLKTTKRSGWIRSGIPRPESISDHMYRMAIMTMLAPASLRARLDTGRCTRIALVHDMAEALVGDITPRDGVSKSEKARRELDVMTHISSEILGSYDGGDAGREFLALFREYEDQETLEARFVKDVDKMELLIQRLDYERAHRGEKDLSTYSWVESQIALPEVKAWCRDVQRERKELWDSWGRDIPPASPSPSRERAPDA